ncbi:MAG: hypothetical protein B7Z51_07905 [Methyloversatilis sp. 12-65-5]|nr:MAG: hypothetical protein B7Z51_07905 [Methyloversatilis sp. 12-65-5]
MNEPVADAPDRCPRCAGRFTCGAAGPAPCGCFTLKIDAEVLAGLRERYVGCLCPACLRELTKTQTNMPTSGLE